MDKKKSDEFNRLVRIILGRNLTELSNINLDYLKQSRLSFDNTLSTNHNFLKFPKVLAKKIIRYFTRPAITPLIDQQNLMSNIIESYEQQLKTLREEVETLKLSSESNFNKLTSIIADTMFKLSNSKVIKRRKKILVGLTFPIYPPMSGGQSRMFGLYQELAKYFDIEIVSFSNSSDFMHNITISPYLTQTLIPKTVAHESSEAKLSEEVGISAADLWIMENALESCKEYISYFKVKALEADYIVSSHVYMYPLVKEANIKNKPIIYEAHNVEYLVKTAMMNNSQIAKTIAKDLYELEKKACMEANLITTCSDEDKTQMIKLYGADKGRIFVVPNGVDCSYEKYARIEDRINFKKLIDFKYNIAVFLGSNYLPNIEACNKIISIAPNCNSTLFLFVGEICNAFLNQTDLPENVKLIGSVTESEKFLILKRCDFALNTVIRGSGTNLKMFDYMSSGIPILTTEFGARGIDNKSCFMLVDDKNIVQKINQFKLSDFKEKTRTARKIVEEQFDWKSIAKKLADRILNN